jgi:hypothetical protein
MLRGVDADADAIGAFLQVVLAAIDGRPLPVLVVPSAAADDAE